MEVFTIIADDTQSNCTFIAADGSVYVLEGDQIDVVPSALVSVTCDARSGPISTPTGLPNFSIFFPTIDTAYTVAPPTSSISSPSGTTTASPSLVTSSVASTVPPYPTATASPSTIGPTRASASAPSSVTNPTGGSTTVPFTGGAARGIKSLGVTFLAFMGLVGAL